MWTKSLLRGLCLKSGTLLSLVSDLFTNSSLGALSFSHRSLLLIPPLAGQDFIFDKLDYLGVRNATEFKLQGPPKVIFRTDAVDLLATHDVRIYKSASMTMKVLPTQAVLLHHRYNHVVDENPRKVNLLPSEFEVKNLQATLINRTNSVFPHGANFNFNTQKVLGICLKPSLSRSSPRWRETQHHCKTPLSSCRSLLLPLEDWYFVRSQENYYTF
ncbi:hypothetical protein OESDEN_08113 [Oesophagostomum dentatum]|uniref:Glycosyltransferase family 92 protein n=1 Tax=Oesophagostomum dentatum TaxID=61180 RepID=A0A0B1T357_OESDE|nr:hypothetical protein OESDEN_08113 [Oesophagostomum dentatum]